MSIKITSQLSEKCKKCPYVNICDEKRLEACAYVEAPNPTPVLEPALDFPVASMNTAAMINQGVSAFRTADGSLCVTRDWLSNNAALINRLYLSGGTLCPKHRKD